MSKLFTYWRPIVLLIIISLLTGSIIKSKLQQREINKLNRQVIVLESNNEKLQKVISKHNDLNERRNLQLRDLAASNNQLTREIEFATETTKETIKAVANSRSPITATESIDFLRKFRTIIGFKTEPLIE